jgi:hypothetical protein
MASRTGSTRTNGIASSPSEIGVSLVLSTDAHSTTELGFSTPAPSIASGRLTPATIRARRCRPTVAPYISGFLFLARAPAGGAGWRVCARRRLCCSSIGKAWRTPAALASPATSARSRRCDDRCREVEAARPVRTARPRSGRLDAARRRRRNGGSRVPACKRDRIRFGRSPHQPTHRRRARCSPPLPSACQSRSASPTVSRVSFAKSGRNRSVWPP